MFHLFNTNRSWSLAARRQAFASCARNSIIWFFLILLLSENSIIWSFLRFSSQNLCSSYSTITLPVIFSSSELSSHYSRLLQHHISSGLGKNHQASLTHFLYVLTLGRCQKQLVPQWKSCKLLIKTENAIRSTHRWLILW